MKKRIAILLASAMLLTSALTGLASCKSGGSNGGADDSKGHVYYLNFKPEQDQQWQDLAKVYTEKTGVQVDVMTAAQGTYEATLASEIAKTDAPTLFQVNGPIGLSQWKDYCLDLSDAAVTKELTSDSFALKDEGKVYGIGYVTETYGIIANTKLLAEAGHSVDEITNFESLKTVVEDITKQKEEGKITFSAFTNPSLLKGEDWRMQTHLADLPLYYEYKADGISSTKKIKGTYLDNYRAIFDLYINNAACEPAIADTKSVDDAVAEFANSQAVFFQNGTWAYGQIKEKNDLGDENLQMIPIYIGVEGEENQGLCTGCENFWTVNKNVADEDIQATLDFLEWVVTSDEGIQSLCKDMCFVAPFKKATEADNLFAKQAGEYIAAGKVPVDWVFSTMPGQNWKDTLGAALAAYARNESDDTWAAVVDAFVPNWEAEFAAIDAAA